MVHPYSVTLQTPWTRTGVWFQSLAI